MNQNPFVFRHVVAASILMLASGVLTAAPPDLTTGGVPGDTISTNLGPTGLRGWVYHVKENSSESRQILIKSVAPGSPAADILAVNDVILGASGTVANPVNFSSDARKSFANAINDAEARDPATLKLVRWRAGLTSTVEITLQSMGAYSATAPYNCPKSALILQQGLQAIMAGETAGQYSFSLLTLLAANNPSDPANAARMARAQTEARALIPNAATRAQMMSDVRDTSSTWQRGHTLVALAEYYLVTGDTEILPAVEAYAVNIAKNTSLFGTVGHIFAEKFSDGSPNGPMGGVYGPVNSTGMPCFLGLLLARECGLANPEIEPAIVRASRFFASYSGKGAIPYGEHEPYPAHENNGKSGLAALCFALQDNRVAEGKFFAKMATAGPSEREIGHTGSYFNYLWSPLGAAVGGEDAAALHFSRVRWMLDLNRRWDWKFDYDCLNGEGGNSGSTYSDFRMSTAALLVYALPLRQLHLTGRGHGSALQLNAADLTDAAAADTYTVTGRSNNDLISDTGSWSPKVRRNAAIQLGVNKASVTTAQRNQLHTTANNTALPAHVRAGACDALGRIANTASASVLANLLGDPQKYVRYAAAEALRYLPNADRQAQLTKILTAAAANARPVLPYDEEEPLHFDHGRLAMLLFYSGNAYGPKGILYNNITGVDRNLLYPAIRAVAANPVGQARSTLASIYPLLTKADTLAVADAVVDTVLEYAPSDRMFASGVRQSGFDLMWKYDVAEGVPAGMKYIVQATPGDRSAALGVLEKYAASYTTITPEPDVIALATSFLNASGGSAEQDIAVSAAAQAVLDAINADTAPETLVPFKGITSATADHPQLTLPARSTVLRVSSFDHALGDSRFTWRKVHGPGDAAFNNNGTAAARDCAVFIGNHPGQYLFEVKMSDSRGLTEVYQTVPVTLLNSDGTLPPNSPPAAIPQSVAVARSTPTQIILAGTDPEGYPLGFSITAPPAHGTLAGTPPYVVYIPDLTYSGPDSLTFSVTDSGGLTASAAVNITVDSTSTVGLAIYEPFDYPAGALSGRSGSSEVGLTGLWAATDTIITSGSFTHGELLTKGGKISDLAGGINRFAGARAISASALAGNGLLADGATLWFSAIVGFDTGGNVTNSRLAIALANSQFNGANFDYWIKNEGSQLGSGVGLVLGSVAGTNGRVGAAQFRDLSAGDGLDGNIIGSWTGAGGGYGAGTRGLIVGKITWGATPADMDRIELYQPATNLVLPATPISVLETQVNQSAFDTLTMARGDKVVCDEIRFGANYGSVLAGTTAMTADLSPPVPNPMVFHTPPAPSGAGAISMVAATAFDPAGVEYYFTCTSGSGSGGSDSGWQESPSYTDSGLSPGVAYSYMVKARDKSSGRNETNISAPAVVPAQTTIPNVTGLLRADAEFIVSASDLYVGSVTHAASLTVPNGRVISQSPTGTSSTASFSTVNLVVSLGAVMTNVPNVAGLAQANAESEIAAANLIVGSVSSQQHASVPAGSVISQNPVSGASVLTGTTVDLVISLGDTTPPAPDPMSFAVAPHATGPSGISMTATTASDPNGVEYFFTCVSGGGNNSGWQDSPVYADSGLTPTTQYAYMVTARDKSSNQNTTQPSAPSSATTPLANGIWIFDGDDNWSNSARWTDATVANGMDATASFMVDLTGNRTVTLDSNRSIGHIVKSDTDSSDHTLTIGGAENTLTLATGSGSPTITNNDPGAARQLIISRPVAGGNGLTIAGAGMVRLDHSGNSYTGVTNISQGILALGVDGSITSSYAVTIAPGAVLDATAKTAYEIPATQPVTFGIDAANSGSCGMISAGELHIGDAVVGFEITGTPDDPVYVLASYSSLHGGSFATAPVPPGYVLDYDYQGNKIALVQIVYMPEITVEQPGLTPIANGGSKDFGTVTAGSETSLDFTIRNTGNADLSLDGTPRIDITGTGASDFTVTAQPAATVAAGGTTTFTVRFAPTEAGARVALLSISNNSGGSPFAISLGGTGESPYETWSGGAAFDADANGDGVDNGLAFLLGAANKDENAVTRLPAVSQIGGALKLTFKCLNAGKRGTAVLKVQYTSDLGLTDPWAGHDSAVVPGEAPATSTVGGVDFVTSVFDANLNHVEATIPASAAGSGNMLFGRLKATP